MGRGRHGRTLQKIATVREELRALDAALAALVADPAGPPPRVPAGLPRHLEVVGAELVALAARLRALTLATNGAPEA